MEYTTVLRRLLEFDLDYYTKLMHYAKAGLKEIERAFKGAEEDEDGEAYEYLTDAAADEAYFLSDTAEILLVSLYHCLERRLKGMLGWVKGEEGSSERVHRLNFRGLIDGFEKHGIPVTTFASFLPTDVLRRFANSWKHNPHKPSEELCTALSLSSKKRNGEGNDLSGLLHNAQIRERMRKILGEGKEDGDCLALVAGYLKMSQDFVRKTADALEKAGRFHPMNKQPGRGTTMRAHGASTTPVQQGSKRGTKQT